MAASGEQLELLLPLGILAGALSGLLGIGGGLIFSPLLLSLGLPPADALATSSLAIVPTTLASTYQHWRRGTLPWHLVGWIGGAALICGLLFASLAGLSEGWELLALQCGVYLLLAGIVRPRPQADPAATTPQPAPLGLVGVGSIAGLMGGMLGLGGGLLMVPLQVRLLRLPIHLAIRISSAAVLLSTVGASSVLLPGGRGAPLVALILGSSAAIGSGWTAARVDQVRPQLLARLLRGLAVLLALDAGRRAVQAYLGG
ncbi:MAG: sulfite exporter TauE/SafE family protein [Aphanocapsa feldmannii 277cV]|uniref:Probable membrane transporter protein n=2 Tax=Aphanocapsa feldmannii TaxID=192050 RepID=A0A524RP27_9CHRO|nr:MAG: sulfite exporter TauE/SafE family protein [Aphanocapsa feldmannii 288cV]TGG93052.1 MAG: sulfite exporter TauE/SafE family protein [Aphanocapsa feldmannii 277cV]